MKTYQLRDWKINIRNKSMEAYNYVCDEKNLMIEINQKENLVLQKFPYFIQYKFYSEEKRLDIIILSDKQHK